ncbi:helix-turn-helix transcriptional regulator [Nonomuraea pusilla]|uniref:Helix-turn-helix domain-containing protein n=1 Tax=Nonomuraea pusilla TaxID=46177 RepID=A0A1H8JG84_9ACTN|nr:helix-turn-helix domain-containing protein [Nonomuraea pusilla]SEN79208.1 Helix-turn-helix domain-containing protein [Nonomuraea pusilla]
MTNTTPNQPQAPEATERPEVVSLLAAGRLLGIGRTKAYRLAKAGEFPCRVLRIGGRYAVPTRGLLALLDPTTQGGNDSRPSGENG